MTHTLWLWRLAWTLSLVVVVVFGATVNVPNSPATIATIQSYVNTANSGDTVLLAGATLYQGICGTGITLGGAGKNLIFDGQGGATIQCNDNPNAAFSMFNQVSEGHDVIRRVTLTTAGLTNSTCVNAISSDVTLDGVYIRNFQRAVTLVSGSARIYSSTFTGNTAGVSNPYGTIVTSFYGDIAIVDSTIRSNTGLTAAGALFIVQSKLNITRGGFLNNMATNYGGVGYLGVGTTVTISGTMFCYNAVTGGYYNAFGGAFFIDAGANVTVTGATFFQNRADMAGAIALYGSLTIYNSTISTNSADSSTGGIIVYGPNGVSGTLNATNSMFFNNRGQLGSAISVEGAGIAHVTGCNITNTNTEIWSVCRTNGPCQFRGVFVSEYALAVFDGCYFQGHSMLFNVDLSGFQRLTVKNSLLYRAPHGVESYAGNSLFTFANNTVTQCGAGSSEPSTGFFQVNGAMYVTGCTFTNNSNEIGVFYIGGPVTIVGSTFAFNEGHLGAAIYMSAGTLFMDNSTVMFNTARLTNPDSYGGAICFNGAPGALSTLLITNTKFIQNTALWGPAMYLLSGYTDSTARIRNCTFSGHSTMNPGGVGLIGMSTEITNSAFSDAYSIQGGAFIVYSYSFLNMSGCTFTRVIARDFGSVAYFTGGKGAWLSNMTFTGFTAPVGGVFYADSTVPLYFDRCSFIGNTATYTSGGAIYMVKGSVSNCYFAHNSAKHNGGGLGSDEPGDIKVTSTTFVANTALGNGGGLASSIQGSLYVSGIYARDNVAIAGNGGGIFVAYVSSNFYCANTTLINNTAISGGGMFVGDILTPMQGNMSSTIMLNNLASSLGGGLYTGSYLSITNSSFTFNVAYLLGGGIYSSDVLNIAGGAISDNTATTGGGVYCRLCSMQFSGGLQIRRNSANDGGAFWCNAGSSFNPSASVVFQGNTQAIDNTVSYNCQCGCCSVPVPPVTITTTDCILATNQQPCGYSCQEGYEYHPTNNTLGMFTCDTSLATPDVNPSPLCLPIPCPVLEAPLNGTMDAPAAPVTGDTANFACALGFSLKEGNASLSCLGPHWIGVVPICDANPCPNLQPPINGRVSNLTGVYGNVVTFHCNDGYTLEGRETATCLGTGTWSSDAPLCESLECPPQPAPGNGTVAQIPQPKTGAVASFFCHLGWSLVGPLNSTCLGGNWSVDPPICAPLHCLTMPAPVNGLVFNADATTDEVATFACNEGFYLQGPTSITCAGVGWRDDAPICAPASCITAASPDTFTTCDFTVAYNTSCAFSCAAGTAGGTLTSTCLQTIDQPTGTFVPGLPLCLPCEAGSFSGNGAANCTLCPNSGRTLTPRTTAESDCLCAPGFYEATPGAGDCVACPTGGACIGDKNQPVAAAGFFRSNNNFSPCTPTVACTGNNYCEIGYQGFMCGSCAIGYFQLNGYCHQCPQDGPWRIVVVVLAGLVIVRLLIAVVKPEAFAERTYGFGSVSISLSFLQIVATFAELKIQWPKGSRSVFDVFSAFNLNIEILDADCVAPLSFWDKTEILLLMPLIVLAMFIVVGSAMIVYHWVREKPERPQLKAYARKVVTLCVASFMMFMSLAYLFLAKAALAIFSCQDEGGGIYTVRTSPSNLCYSPTWYRLAPLGVFGIIFYIVAVPIVVHAVFVRGRRKYGDAVARKSIFSHFLVSKYRPETWFWEVAVMLRKLLMVIVATFGVGDSYGQVAASFAVILVAALISLPWSPYRWKKHNIVECVSLFASLGVLFCGLLLTSKSTKLPPALISAIDAGAVACVVVALVVQGACLALEARIYARVLALRTKLEPDRVTSLNAHNDRIVHIVPRQTFIVTVTSEGSVRSWHQETLLPARAFEMKERVQHATVRGSELYFARGDELLTWDLDLQVSLDARHVESSITALVNSDELLMTGHENGDLLFWPFRKAVSAPEEDAKDKTEAFRARLPTKSEYNPVFISETADTEGTLLRTQSVLKPQTFGVATATVVHAHAVAITALKRVGLVVYSADALGHIRKWSTKSFKQLRQWTMPEDALRNGVTITAVEEVAATLVVGTSDGSLHSLVFDEKLDETGATGASAVGVEVASGDKDPVKTAHGTLRMQIARISCLSLCNGMLLSASEDGRIIVLSGATRQLLQLLPDAEAAVTALSVLTDGTVVYGDAKGILRKYRIISEWHMQEPDPHVFTQLWTYLQKRVRGETAAATEVSVVADADSGDTTTQHDVYDELGVLAESLDLPAIPWRVLDGASAESVVLALAGETQKRRDHSDGLRRRNRASSSFT